MIKTNITHSIKQPNYMKNLIITILLMLIPLISYCQGPASCACVWSDAQGNLNCVSGNCGGQNWSNCYNQISTPNLWVTNSCPNPSGTNCNPYMWNTSLNGSCWYQGAGCSGTVVCTYVQSLPVEMIYFIGKQDDRTNVLTWQTASEHNTSYYMIYRSTTGEFNEKSIIGYLQSVGNSTTTTNYTFNDNEYDDTINYYLLIQMDMNGEYVEYGPIVIDNSSDKVIMKVVNMLGQTVGDDYKGIVFIIYDNGSMLRLYR